MSLYEQRADGEEHSALIRARNDEDEGGEAGSQHSSGSMDLEDHDLGIEDSFTQPRSSWYLLLLTLSIGGLQIVWSVELSNGSPFLLSLGMSKALVAFVWLAGPMTGVLVQPYIGIISDRCRTSWGKRKPFMIGGTLGTVVSSFLLAYCKEIVHFVGGWSKDAPYDGYYKGLTTALATIMMWVLDFSINAVQAAIRAFIADGAPSVQQEAANAWASRLVGVGNVLGYIFGYLDLPKVFSFLGNGQFKVLCAIASIALVLTVSISTLTVKERNPQEEPPSSADKRGLGIIEFFKQVFLSIKHLPVPIRQVCEVQFCQWMGWFPFLFYITTYVGQLYVNPSVRPGMPTEEVDNLWEQATRVGTFALLLFAIVSLTSNLLLPFFVVSTRKASAIDDSTADIRSLSSTSPIGTRQRSASYSEVAQHQQSLTRPSLLQTRYGSFSLTTRSAIIHKVMSRLQVSGLTLQRAWMLSQLWFSLCMFSTFFISTPVAATVMVSLVGIPWSLSLWAPFALISSEIATRDEARRMKHRRRLLNQDMDSNSAESGHDAARAGIVLGIHNMAVSSPQVIATIICSFVFKALQKPRDVPGDTSVAWTLRLGGIAGLGAALLTWRMQRSVVANNRTPS